MLDRGSQDERCVTGSLQIDSGAVLKAVAMANYPNNTSPSHFITISSKNNVEISGSGTIDGNGQDWWTAYNNSGGTISRPRLINGSGSNDKQPPEREE